MDSFSADSEMWPDWRILRQMTVLDYSLEKLSKAQRTSFLVVVVVLMTIAVIGNLATIVFNLKRQIRPLFRSCLVSLAISDIVTAIFTTTAYISQFIIDKTVLWILGEFLCNWIPFFTTQAILVNSITLVCIALDRYMAVVKVLKSSWEPKAISCVIGTLVVWAIGAGIASPMVSAYFIVDVTVAVTDPNNRTVGVRKYPAQICINDKSENASYYGIVFASVFLPIFIAFLWLNATIAAEIYNRRNPLNSQGGDGSPAPSSVASSSSSQNPKQNEGSTTTKTTSNMSSSSIKSNKSNQRHISANNPVAVADNDNQLGQEHGQQPPPHQEAPSTTTAAAVVPRPRKNYQSSNNCRKTRQLRMFKVIIVIMTTFLVCRLPTWIFLLVKLNRDLSSSPSWVLHFSFGILSLANCAINPFLYTFLTETMRFGSQMKSRLKRLCCGGCTWSQREDASATVESKTISLHREPFWKTICCWEHCGKEELPDDKNLIDYGGEYDGKQFRRKSYTLNGKGQLSCISSGHMLPPFGHYANVYLGSPGPVHPPDPDHFVDIDLLHRK